MSEEAKQFGAMARARPYDGQPWTSHGVRGSTEIKGITFRDLRDAFIRAICQSNGEAHPENYAEAEKGCGANLREKHAYESHDSGLDIIAVAQNLTCEIEKLMGIYPNIPSTEGKTFDELMENVPIVGSMEDVVDFINGEHGPEPIECNLPFARIPRCAHDPGTLEEFVCFKCGVSYTPQKDD